MNEDHFWGSLEFRICREFKGMPTGKLQRMWCDGLVPKQYFVSGRRPRIIGTAWICGGTDQREWEFILRLPSRINSREEIDWSSLLPPENVTRWISIDEERGRIQIEPAAAIPDLS
jgi:hypothetical protein